MTVQVVAHIQAVNSPADSFRRSLQGALRGGSGVLIAATDLLVAPNGTPNMTVLVAAGNAFIPNTQTTVSAGSYHLLNDAQVSLAIATSDPTNPRNDLVVASVQDAQYAGGTNLGLLQVVTGTPAGIPADPSTPANSIVLARVRVNAGVTSITSGVLTDLRPSLASTAQLSGLLTAAQSAGTQSRFFGQLATQGSPAGASPLGGNWADGDVVYDSKGAQWVCTSPGSPGTWLYAGGGPYHAEVQEASTQSFTSAATTVIAFDTVLADPNGNFTTGVSAHYSVPLIGRYLVVARFAFTSSVNGSAIYAYLNGVQVLDGDQPNVSRFVCQLSGVVRCGTAGQGLDIRALQNSGGPVNNNAPVYASFTYLGSL